MSKRKILLVALTVAMAAILVAGGTLAYLTDYDSQRNTFTAGKVGINLDEAVVENDPKTDNLVPKKDENGDEVRTDDKQEYKLHPNMTVAKDPTITVDADSEWAYVGAIVTITGDLYDLIGVPGYKNLDIHGLASGGLMTQTTKQGTYGTANLFVYENDNYAIYQEVGENNVYGDEEGDKSKNQWKLYIFMKNPQAAGSKIVLFDTLTIPSDYTNVEMAKLNGMSIDVEAYAVQADGFEVEGSDIGCYNALTDAFKDWDFANDFTTVDGKEPAI